MMRHKRFMGADVALRAGAGFRPGAVNFDGTNDYLLRGGGLTGAADGKAGTISFWCKAAADDSTLVIFTGRVSSSVRLNIQRVSTNVMSIQGRNSANTTILSMASSATNFNIAGGWRHFIASWNLATAAEHIYVNDSSDLAAGSTLTDDTIAYSTSVDNWAVGSNQAGAAKWNGDIADLWFEDSYIDLSNSANRRLFISAAGKPVSLGANGETPTGSSPIVFFGGATDDWHTNKGTGGGFTENGALTDAATNPSD